MVIHKKKNQTTKTAQLSEEARLEIAMKHYKRSKDKNYPKAWNSIGKFYHYGWTVDSKNDVEAIGYYKAGAGRLDVYATINCGHSEMKNYYLSKNLSNLINAKNYYLDAAEYDTSEAWLWLGIVSEELITFHPENALLLLADAKNYYLKSFANTENKYSATGWYMLGCLICNYPILAEDSSLKDFFGSIAVRNWAIECFSSAFNIFQNVYEKESVSEDKYTYYYNCLRENFLNINNKDKFNMQ